MLSIGLTSFIFTVVNLIKSTFKVSVSICLGELHVRILLHGTIPDEQLEPRQKGTYIWKRDSIIISLHANINSLRLIKSHALIIKI